VTLCDVHWGSHGCDLPAGHEAAGVDHRCGEAGDECSELRVPARPRFEPTLIRQRTYVQAPDGEWQPDEWTDWRDFPFAFRLDGDAPLTPTVATPRQ
jgi:hypothetical protein